MSFIKRFQNFVVAHPELFTILGLGILFYFIFFHNIWAYALMDVDESRYVSMAKDMFNTKDFMTLYLNNEYFFEKPPLYFWGECLSFALFGQISEFTARFPVALYGSACAFLVYWAGRKTISRFYGAVSSLILATSLEFLILAKFAILDIVVATCIGFSLYFGMMVYFCKENHKKYFWWLFYIFSGLAVMAKGLPGFVVPFGSMFFIAIVSKKFKEIFKPQYLIVGFVLFFLITIPWHVLMLKTYDPLFWNEYVVKHHLARFLGTEGVINRTQPFYFYFLTILWGFFPWIVSCVTVWIKDLINIIKKKEYKLNYEGLNEQQRFILYNAIAFIFTLLFFTSSETKLVTYILPLYLPLACLGANIWCNYIKKSENDNLINKTVYAIGGIFLFASIAAIFTPLFLPEQLCEDISCARTLVIILLFAAGLGSILFAKKKLYMGVFITYVIFMAILSGFGTEKFYKVDYKFGQDDLLKYAEYSKQVNKPLVTYQFSHKYSLIYYGEKPVLYGLELKPKDIKGIVLKDKKLLIIPHKRLKPNKQGICDIDTELKMWIEKHTIMDGRKYVLVGVE